MAERPWMDVGLGVEARVDALVAEMTLDEKLAQLGGVWITALVAGDRLDPDAVLRRIPHGTGHVTRIGASTGLGPEARARLVDGLQRVVVERTRLGVPLVVHEESTGGYCARDATVFPQAIGLASTWDPDLVREVGEVIRAQMVAVGARHTLAPVLDVARDPRWGRLEETYGEDPVLAGVLGTAYVRGVQGDDLRAGVICTGKHFLGYAASDGGLNHGPVHLGPRELREVHAEPFAAAIRDAGLASVMNSYSSVDGLPCAGSASILTGLLRDELGFDGVVVADYYAVVLLASHHRTADGKRAAAAQALRAGLDLELPATDCFGDPLREAVEAGEVGVDLVDRALRRVLASKVRLGLFEQPYVDASIAVHTYQTPEQRALARRAAAASVVLLTNDGVLPLGPEALRRVAVVGPGADDERLLQGDYHYPAHVEIVYEGGLDMPGSSAPAADADADGAGGDGVGFLPEGGGSFQAGPWFTPHVTPLAGLRAALEPAGVEVVTASGCEVTGDDRSGFDAAIEAARGADVAVVVAAGRSGLRPACTVGEARDASDLRLTGVQEDLVRAVAATGTPVVLVVLSGRAHALADVVDHVGALVQLWPPGEEGGHGLADVLVGAVDATGRLPVSLPRSVGQVPVFAGHRAGGGRSLFYGPYVDGPTTPLFPFGHGLSYTTFTYGSLTARVEGDDLVVEVEVANTGDRDGVELVALHVRDEVASVARPVRQLVGFTRVPLAPGEARAVRFRVHRSRLAGFDEHMRYVCEPGWWRLWVGTAEGRVELPGPVSEHRQRDVVATRVEVV